MDPIAVDVPARVPPAPATTTAASAAKPPAPAAKPEPAKPDPAKPDPAKPPFPTPAPAAGAKSLLGKVANALGLQPTRRQTMIVGAAAVSLVAGITAVRLITPDKKPDAAGQPLVAEAAKSGTGSTPPAAEHSKPSTETEPAAPAAAPLAPLAPVTKPKPVVDPPVVPLGPTADVQPDVPPVPAVAPIAPTLPVEPSASPPAKPVPPPTVTVLPPADPGAFGPPKKKPDTSAVVAPVLTPDPLAEPMVHAPTPKPGADSKSTAVPPPGELVPIGPPSVVPAAASEPAKPVAPGSSPPVATGGLPMAPAAPPVPLPALPGDKPMSPPVKPAELPATPPASVVPPIGGPAPMVPAVPSTGSTTVPPVTLPAAPTSTGGTKPADEKKPVVSPSGISLPAPDGVGPMAPASSLPVATGGLPAAPPMALGFTKPAGATDPKPTAAPERAATTSYDVDLHEPRQGDSYESISRDFYNDPKYAAALRAYNRNQPLTGSVRVEVPPIHVLKKQYPQLVGPVVPAGRSADGWGPAGGGGGVAPAFQPSGARTYTVPTGGMRMPDIAKAALGNPSRWQDIYNLNPQLPTNEVLPPGTLVKLPAN